MSASLILASSSSTARKSSPPLLLKAPGTFSQTAKVGYFPPLFSLISSMIRTASMNKPLRVVSSSPFFVCFSPARFPATLKSWHGEPKVIISTGSISAPDTLLTSPRCRMGGNLDLVTAIGYGSTSDAHTGMIPQRAPARGKPPDPSKRLPNFILSPFLRESRALIRRPGTQLVSVDGIVAGADSTA